MNPRASVSQCGSDGTRLLGASFGVNTRVVWYSRVFQCEAVQIRWLNVPHITVEGEEALLVSHKAGMGCKIDIKQPLPWTSTYGLGQLLLTLPFVIRRTQLCTLRPGFQRTDVQRS